MGLERYGILRTVAIAVVIVCITAGAAVAAAKSSGGGALMQKLRKAGVANVGVVSEPPYSNLQPNGTVAGLAPTLVSDFLKAYGVPKVHGFVATYGDAIPGLLAGRWDIVASALDVTPARCAVAVFGDDIAAGADQFAVKPGNPLGLYTVKDLIKKHATVGILSGAAEIGFVEAAGVPSSQVITFNDDPSELADLKAGRIDAIMEETTALATGVWASDPTKKSDFELTPIIPDGPYSVSSIAFRKSDVATRNLFNTWLTKIEKSGQFARISKQNGFNASVTLNTHITTAQACTTTNLHP
jgi:polar amino acid transport system substrate-binding protein